MEDMNKDLCYIKDGYISWAKAQIANGANHVKLEELDSIVDAIKDIAEAEKYCCEAEYYKTVVEAMRDGAEDSQYAYYRPSYRMGYTPSVRTALYSGPMPSHDATSSYLDNAWRMENDPSDMDTDQYLHGKAYSNYKKARRHYTETHSDHDREIMNANAGSHLSAIASTIREMWTDADQSLRQRMKMDLSNLIAEMN